MKDHVQKLADKAKKSVPHGLTPDKWIEVYNEKFAELIVKECADIACEHMELNEGTDYNIGSKIKQHFGVEE